MDALDERDHAQNPRHTGSFCDDALVTDPSELNPLWLVVLVGALSGVIGSVIGPVLQRIFTRNDRALDARQKWVHEKLLTVFGVGEEVRSSDEPTEYFRRLVPPNGGTPHEYFMHDINWAVSESPEYMLLQPRRSRWARLWLDAWHHTLVAEHGRLHGAFHAVLQADTSDWSAWNKANARYERRVRRVASSISMWATGQWITHPSLRLWLGARHRFQWFQSRRSLRWLSKIPQESAPCDCVDEELVAKIRGYGMSRREQLIGIVRQTWRVLSEG